MHPGSLSRAHRSRAGRQAARRTHGFLMGSRAERGKNEDCRGMKPQQGSRPAGGCPGDLPCGSRPPPPRSPSCWSQGCTFMHTHSPLAAQLPTGLVRVLKAKVSSRRPDRMRSTQLQPTRGRNRDPPACKGSACICVSYASTQTRCLYLVVMK